jgi:hypothetical protein
MVVRKVSVRKVRTKNDCTKSTVRKFRAKNNCKEQLYEKFVRTTIVRKVILPREVLLHNYKQHGKKVSHYNAIAFATRRATDYKRQLATRRAT